MEEQGGADPQRAAPAPTAAERVKAPRSDCSEGGGTGKEKLEGGPGVRSGLC